MAKAAPSAKQMMGVIMAKNAIMADPANSAVKSDDFALSVVVALYSIDARSLPYYYPTS
jgi:hypothetical protein